MRRLGAAALLLIDDIHHLGSAAEQLVATGKHGGLVATSEDHVPLRRGGEEIALQGLAIDDARLLWQRLEELFGPTPHGAPGERLGQRARQRVEVALRPRDHRVEALAGATGHHGHAPARRAARVDPMVALRSV